MPDDKLREAVERAVYEQLSEVFWKIGMPEFVDDRMKWRREAAAMLVGSLAPLLDAARREERERVRELVAVRGCHMCASAEGREVLFYNQSIGRYYHTFPGNAMVCHASSLRSALRGVLGEEGCSGDPIRALPPEPGEGDAPMGHTCKDGQHVAWAKLGCPYCEDAPEDDPEEIPFDPDGGMPYAPEGEE